MAVFQSTLPARGATLAGVSRVKSLYDFNPRSPHGERPGGINNGIKLGQFQSTLPARGATSKLMEQIGRFYDISIHAPRTGSDFTIDIPAHGHNVFQSTLPARGATMIAVSNILFPPPFQSTLPARGATRCNPYAPLIRQISIHAPRTGSDVRAHGLQYRFIHISIHAPRTGSDWTVWENTNIVNHFNPRSPHGERQDL